MNKAGAEESKGSDTAQAQAKPSGLADAIKAGRVLAAPSKEEKEAESMFSSLAGGKKKKGKGRKQQMV